MDEKTARLRTIIKSSWTRGSFSFFQFCQLLSVLFQINTTFLSAFHLKLDKLNYGLAVLSTAQLIQGRQGFSADI